MLPVNIFSLLNVMPPVETKPMLYVFFGLIASGKSTLAERFASQFGFVCYNTDKVRKQLAGIDLTARQPERFNEGIYTKNFTTRTYLKMLDLAAEEIRKGKKAVVLDGSYSSREERLRVRRLAEELDAGYLFILCTCSEETVRDRLELRAKDPAAVSDGRWEIYQVQKDTFQAPTEFDASHLIEVETERPVDELIENLAATLHLR